MKCPDFKKECIGMDCIAGNDQAKYYPSYKSAFWCQKYNKTILGDKRVR